MAVRCVAKVADAYKLDIKTKRIPVPGNIMYEDRRSAYPPPPPTGGSPPGLPPRRENRHDPKA